MRDSIKQQYESRSLGSEKGVAVSWVLLFAILIVGSLYNRPGKPAIEASLDAITVGSASNHSSD